MVSVLVRIWRAFLPGMHPEASPNSTHAPAAEHAPAAVGYMTSFANHRPQP